MIELIQLLLSDKVTALALAIGMGSILCGFGYGSYAALEKFGAISEENAKAKRRRLEDEQEHRQKLEREKQKAENTLAAAMKLEEVISIVVADRSVGEAIREQIDAIHPPVKARVQLELEESPEETDTKRGRRKSRR